MTPKSPDNDKRPRVSVRLWRDEIAAIDGARDLYPNADSGLPSRSEVLRAMLYAAFPLVTDRDLIAALDARRGTMDRGAFLVSIVRKYLGEKK